MTRSFRVVALLVGMSPCALWAQKPYNEADFRRMRVIETWEKYGDKLTWGKGQCLAILDDGCDLSVPQWQASLPWGTKVVASYNAFDHNDDPRPVPPGYHGTSVGYPSSLNYNGVWGVAYNNHVAQVRCITIVHLRKDEAATLSKGLQWVIDHHQKYNITTVNLSPVDDNPHAEPVATAIDAKLKRLRELNIWVSAPCGNNQHTGGISWPACQPDCFAIGAVKAQSDIVHCDRSAKTDILVPAAATSSSNAYIAAASMILREAIAKTKYDWRREGPNLPAAMMGIFQKTGAQIYDPATKLRFRRLDLLAAMDQVFGNAAFEATVATEIRVGKTADRVVEPTALTIDGAFGRCINGLSFQQEAVTSNAGCQYVGYYDAERHVCLARRKLPNGAWETIRFKDYDFHSDDAHNTISLGICPKDGTIHIAFDHHVQPLHYRVSRKRAAGEPQSTKWEASLFGSVTSELEKGKPLGSVTYPRFWRTPDGGLQFCWRVGGSGNGDRMLADYHPESGSWKNFRQIDSRQGAFSDRFNTSPSRCSYPNGYTYDANGRLHVTWVWRERTQGANHDLMYAYSDDRGSTWRNNGGQVVGDCKVLGKLIRVDSPGIMVVPISRADCLMNTQSQAVDSKGGVHAVMWHATEETLRQSRAKSKSCWGPPDARRYHHYRRDSDGTWRHTELPGVAGNRPKLFFDKHDNAVLIFNGWRMAEDDVDGRGVFFVTGDLIIMGATAAAKWADWKVIHVEKGPFVNEMLGDPYRWLDEGVLSILVQQSPGKSRQPTPLRVLDFTFL